jgi:glucosamine 6-phosphate synthetase-like amidotransferase/phosphosugar isomerase protein
VSVTKLRGGASALLDEIAVPQTAIHVLIHVRDHTKGHPGITANNHPIRHGNVVGIHNGVIANDDALLEKYGIEREEPDMTVDSEAIFALMELHENEPRRLGELRGALATAWLDERDPTRLFLARGAARPLWVGVVPGAVFFASTRGALAIVEAALGLRLDASEVREGRVLEVVDGSVVRERRFRRDRHYRDDSALPPVRAPQEAVTCLRRLATIAATAA